MRRLPPLPLLPLQLALLLLPLLLLFAAPAQAERKVALVIGNGAYQHVAPLPNPANDARLMAQSLKAIGFELVGGQALTDVVTKAELDKAVRTFGEMIRGGGVGVFFYAGHGVQVDGKNYLIPVGADVTSRAQIKYELVDADFVLDEMNESSTKVNLVILDACRNNPFAGRGLRAVTPGLATVLAPKGTLIAYSTAPGKTASDGSGKNSPFTTALARQLRTPGQRIEDVFINVGVEVEQATGGAQSPWQSNSLRGVFCLNGACGQQTASPAPAAPVAVLQPAPAPAPAPASAQTEPSVNPKTAPPPTPEEVKLIEAMREKGGGSLVLKLAKPLAARGSIYGKYGLGWASQDSKAEHQATLLAANQGIPLAMVGLAEFLARSPAPEDGVEARAWLRKAIELGEPDGKYRLGMLLIEGKGGPKDVPGGERLLAQAARERPFYYPHIGQFFWDAAGKALPQAEADAKGLAYYKRGAELHDTYAMSTLAGAYLFGEHAPKDENEGIRLYTLTANLGDTGAMTLLGQLYKKKDKAESLIWYKRAADHGDSMARLTLGWMYRDGDGVPMDFPKALALFRGLAEEGDKSGAEALGNLYEKGLGVPKDQAQAYFWYTLAGGFAKEDKDRMEAQLVPAEQARVKAQAARWKPKKPAH